MAHSKQRHVATLRDTRATKNPMRGLSVYQELGSGGLRRAFTVPQVGA